MDKKEQKYKVTSPIKFDKKRYEEGDFILLDEETAEGLHVELVDNSADEEAEAAAKKKAAEETEAKAKAEKEAAAKKKADEEAEAKKKSAASKKKK